MNGKDITKEKEYRRNQKIGRVYQNPAFGTCPGMTILENMAIADHKENVMDLQEESTKNRFPIIGNYYLP